MTRTTRRDLGSTSRGASPADPHPQAGGHGRHVLRRQGHLLRHTADPYTGPGPVDDPVVRPQPGTYTEEPGPPPLIPESGEILLIHNAATKDPYGHGDAGVRHGESRTTAASRGGGAPAPRRSRSARGRR